MNENEEIWRDINGYEGLYEVSNMGRVKSLNYNRTNQEKILKLGKNKNGYMIVVLCKNGKTKTCQVHRLVANAFIGNPNNLPMINHKDENPSNNCVDNLEWCDASYNQNYGTANQKRIASTDYKSIAAKIDYKAIAEKLTNRQDQSKQVYQYSLDLKLIKIWESTMECKRNGYNQGHVAACCRGERKSHKGFIWSYIELKK